jgi:YegS/Rv2252/BmrU family lipid kinase
MSPADGAAPPATARPHSCAVIVNPTAGIDRGRLSVGAVADLWREHGVSAEVLVTSRSGEAVDLAAQAAERHPVVAALGGDGTVHEVARGLLGTGAALAVLPAGSGNDFAFALGIATTTAGLQAALAGQVRRIDVAYLDGRPFFNSAGFFFSGLVSARAKRLWRRAGRLRYVLAALSALATYRPPAARWSLNGEAQVRTGRWLLAEVANGPRSGGGFLLAPDAELDDGLLDFCLVGPMPLWSLLRVFPAATRGVRVEHPAISRPQAAGARLELEEAVAVHLDGEPTRLPAGSYDLRLDRGHLAVLAPAAGGGSHAGAEQGQTR